jgi:hypothetical protein
MPGPAKTAGKSIKVTKLGQTTGRDYGASVGKKKSQNVRNLSAKK